MPQHSPLAQFNWDNSYAERLPDFYVACDPTVVAAPKLLQFNSQLAAELGLKLEHLAPESLANLFSGNELPHGAQPLAQAYAGHQFGGFVPQLGDGRALLLGEVIDNAGRRRDIALKGSGPTPFSRGGDGKAGVGPVLREYLIGEAMHALGVATTRALAAVGTGESVMRQRPQPGAVLTRVAASHIRVGTFQFFAARSQDEQVRQLAEYVIERHYPSLAEESDRYLLLLEAVADKQAALLAQWMLLGFIHGVMNTDNMAIAGETIDYGPCAFMEAYRSAAVFSSIDTAGRYAYSNQPFMARWNLARFAETLLPLIDKDNPEQAIEKATAIINDFIPRYEAIWDDIARAKLGLMTPAEESDRLLASDWLELLEKHEVDYTLAWRNLADAAEGKPESLTSLFPSQDALEPWLERWRQRLGSQSPATTAQSMRTVNPIYIPRNHLVEEALAAAQDKADLARFQKLLDVITDPFVARPGLDEYASPAPREFTACYRTFCGT